MAQGKDWIKANTRRKDAIILIGMDCNTELGTVPGGRCTGERVEDRGAKSTERGLELAACMEAKQLIARNTIGYEAEAGEAWTHRQHGMGRKRQIDAMVNGGRKMQGNTTRRRASGI